MVSDKASLLIPLSIKVPYVAAGQLTLRNLKLKKGALDKFQLPVDVLEGAWFIPITSFLADF